jgi:hypothetical protein
MTAANLAFHSTMHGLKRRGAPDDFVGPLYRWLVALPDLVLGSRARRAFSRCRVVAVHSSKKRERSRPRLPRWRALGPASLLGKTSTVRLD